MSRAFVKEDETGNPDDLADLAVSPHPNYTTQAGLDQLRVRLATLQRSETADAQLVQRQLRWLQARIAAAIPVSNDGRDPARVAFGATVKVRELASGAVRSYRIVGEDEADPESGSVSWVSPLARALVGAEIGDVAIWRRPAGDLEVEVLAIEYSD
ncbi:MAG TPA: GreA/GreB family elongation factor [Solimonas sp.]|nr:GreA/GreB family elongation factor [Solimonas sp.]